MRQGSVSASVSGSMSSEFRNSRIYDVNRHTGHPSWFTLHEPLGEGSSTEVWSFCETNTLCARVFRKKDVNHRSISQELHFFRLFSERHVTVVPRFEGLFQLKNRAAIVQQRLGADLSSEMSRIKKKWQFGELSWSEFVSLIKHAFIMMLRTVSEFHMKGFLHLDIKPSNFCLPLGEILEQSTKLYLIDFEKSNLSDDSSTIMILTSLNDLLNLLHCSGRSPRQILCESL